MEGMTSHFTPESMKFLRGLARHNEREWFEARREVYERALKTPMLAVVDEISMAMERFAPEHVRPPHKIMMRIYRDTRFSNDKRPYKTHLAAWWSRRGMEKTSGGGFFLQVGVDQVLVAAGVYMPDREQLLKLRRWMSDHHAEYSPLLKRTLRAKGLGLEKVDAQMLSRMPKGFAADDPADELVRAKNWGVHAILPATIALEVGFAREVARRFRASAAMVDTLNGAILQGGTTGTVGALDEGRWRVE